MRMFHVEHSQFHPQTACPAQNPLDHAHWKLYPPNQPVTSTASPITNNPGTSRAPMVFENSPSVSTPPTVTSAFAYPSVPAGTKAKRLIISAVFLKALFG